MRVHAAILTLLVTASARAERVPLPPEQLSKEATHVVTGAVKVIYAKDVETGLYGKGTVETHYLLEIEVSGVEKGTALEKGDIIYARCWRLKKHGAAGLVPGPSGHFAIPAEGATIRAYLARGRYGPTGQTDNGFAVVYTNGIEASTPK
jgi:hypothetical protein